MKITILGKGLVGKSSLAYRFIYYDYPQDDPMLECENITNIQINGKEYKVEILDTAGEEDYQDLLDMWIAFSEGFLLEFYWLFSTHSIFQKVLCN